MFITNKHLPGYFNQYPGKCLVSLDVEIKGVCDNENIKFWCVKH